MLLARPSNLVRHGAVSMGKRPCRYLADHKASPTRFLVLLDGHLVLYQELRGAKYGRHSRGGV